MFLCISIILYLYTFSILLVPYYIWFWFFQVHFNVLYMHMIVIESVSWLQGHRCRIWMANIQQWERHKRRVSCRCCWGEKRHYCFNRTLIIDKQLHTSCRIVHGQNLSIHIVDSKKWRNVEGKHNEKNAK